MNHVRAIQPATGGATPAMSVIAALLERRTGHRIEASRAWRLEANLKPMLRDLGMSDLDELVTNLVVSRDGALSDRVVDTLLNQETSFFRDAAVFEQVAEALDAMRQSESGRRLRIWSAGCSNGQEPLSLAMLLDERGIDGSLVEIVATDVSQGAIARAQAGRYTQFEIQRGLSMHRMMRWFDGDGADWTARAELLRRVRFHPNNIAFDAPPAGQFDLILCRNVLLYFSPEMRRDTFDRFARSLRKDGLLVLGAGETVIGQTERFHASQRWRGFYDLRVGEG